MLCFSFHKIGFGLWRRWWLGNCWPPMWTRLAASNVHRSNGLGSSTCFGRPSIPHGFCLSWINCTQKKVEVSFGEFSLLIPLAPLVYEPPASWIIASILNYGAIWQKAGTLCQLVALRTSTADGFRQNDEKSTFVVSWEPKMFCLWRTSWVFKDNQRRLFLFREKVTRTQGLLSPQGMANPPLGSGQAAITKLLGALRHTSFISSFIKPRKHLVNLF